MIFLLFSSFVFYESWRWEREWLVTGTAKGSQVMIVWRMDLMDVRIPLCFSEAIIDIVIRF